MENAPGLIGCEATLDNDTVLALRTLYGSLCHLQIDGHSSYGTYLDFLASSDVQEMLVFKQRLTMSLVHSFLIRETGIQGRHIFLLLIDEAYAPQEGQVCS